ncbi:DNA replication complex GINS protein PSF2 [Psidium guajava]|nr:DNA replication complex GINS protein PSF2 [Psidium guajava]
MPSHPPEFLSDHAPLIRREDRTCGRSPMIGLLLLPLLERLGRVDEQ